MDFSVVQLLNTRNKNKIVVLFNPRRREERRREMASQDTTNMNELAGENPEGEVAMAEEVAQLQHQMSEMNEKLNQMFQLFAETMSNAKREAGHAGSIVSDPTTPDAVGTRDEVDVTSTEKHVMNMDEEVERASPENEEGLMQRGLQVRKLPTLELNASNKVTSSLHRALEMITDSLKSNFSNYTYFKQNVQDIMTYMGVSPKEYRDMMGFHVIPSPALDNCFVAVVSKMVMQVPELKPLVLRIKTSVNESKGPRLMKEICRNW